MSKEEEFIKRLSTERKDELEKSELCRDMLCVFRKLLVEVYPQDAHFIYELLQNAEDVTATHVRFVLTDESLQFIHNGRPFDESDVMSLSNIAKSSKLIRRDEDTRIGQFGVGFKSVYAYTNSPTIHSGNWHFKITQLIVPEVANEILGTEEGVQNTLFTIPFDHDRKTKQNAYNEIKEELEKLHPRTVLFLRHIKKIEIEISGSITCVEISRPDNSILDEHIQIKKNDVVINYLRFVKDISLDVEEGGELLRKNVPIGIAYLLEKNDENSKTTTPNYKIVQDVDAKVFVYFPAGSEKSNLKFSINAGFAPTISRSEIRNCRANDILIEAVSRLQIEKLDFLKRFGFLTTEFLGVLPNGTDIDLKISKYKCFYKNIINAFKSGEYLPTCSGEFRSVEKVFMGESRFMDVVSEDKLREITGSSDVCWLRNASQRNTKREDYFLRNWELGIKSFGVKELFRSTYRLSVNQFLCDLEECKLADLYVLIIDQNQVVLDNRKKSDSYRKIFDELQRDVRASQLIRLQDGRNVSLDGIDSRVVWSEKPCDVRDGILFVNSYFGKEMGRGDSRSVKLQQFFKDFLGVDRYDEKSTLRYYIDNFNLVDKASGKERLETNVENFRVLIRLLKSGTVRGSEFRDFPVLASIDNVTFRPLSSVFIDGPYRKTGLARITASLSRVNKYKLNEEYSRRLSDDELQTFYSNMKELGVMTQLGVIKCNTIDNNNPKRKWLLDAPGKKSSPMEEDYVVPALSDIISSIIGARESNEAESIGELLWNLILDINRDQLQARYYKNISQKNNGGERSGDSTFIDLLKNRKWIRHRDGRMVTPREVSFMDIPPFWKRPQNGYENIGLKAIDFAKSKNSSDFQLEGAWDLLGLRNPDVISSMKVLISKTLKEKGGDESLLIDALRRHLQSDDNFNQDIREGERAPQTTKNNKDIFGNNADGREKKFKDILVLDDKVKGYLDSLKKGGANPSSPIMKSKDVDIYSVAGYLSLNLQIPPYQRPYEWTERNVVELLEDICDARRTKKLKYRIGSIILHNENGVYNIVDGQQRTLTLLLVLCALRVCSQESISANITDIGLRLLSNKEFYPALSQCKVSRRNLRNNLVHIIDYLKTHADAKETIGAAIEKQLEVVVVVVNEQSEAFQLFDSQNSKGRPLEPHDLLKAYHLRLIPGEKNSPVEQHLSGRKGKTLAEELVEKWEEYDSNEISSLFNEMLFRIYKWNRKEKCERFTVQDMGVFKGIPMKQVNIGLRPTEEPKKYAYALRACALRAKEARDKFQIGEPIVPGEDFFDMVAHYFSLLDKIKEHISKIPEVREVVEHGGSAYLEPLFRAILLDYFDRFGFEDSEPELAIRKLCRWVYTVRLDVDYLGPKTPNRYALGADGANSNYSNNVPMFAKIRTAVEHTEIINIHLNAPSDEKDSYQELRKALNKLGNV